MATAGESYRASSGSVVASNGDLSRSAAPITMRACFEVWITKGGSGDEIGARSHFGGWYLGRCVDRRADGSALAVEHFNVSPASALANLGATAAGAYGYR